MKKILLMSLSILISSALTARFSYAFEKGELIDEFTLDYINTYATEDESFIFDYINDHEDTEEKRSIIDKNAENILLSPPPLPSKPKSSNGRKKVELTEIEKNEIIRIHTAGPEGLNNLNRMDRNTWQKIFKDELSLNECFKRRLGHKKRRLKVKRYRKNPEVKKRSQEYRNRPEVKKRYQEYGKKYRNKPEIKEREKKRRKEYYSRPEVKKRKKEYNARSEVKEYQKEYNTRPEVKKRKKEYQKEHYSLRPEVKKYRKEQNARQEVKERRKRKGTANLSPSPSSKSEVTSVHTAHFFYASEKGEFADSELSPMDSIHDEFPPINENINNFTDEIFSPPLPLVFPTSENNPFQQSFFKKTFLRTGTGTGTGTGTEKQNDHLNSEQAILMAPSSFVFMMPPPPSKPKSSNGRKKVELTEIEKNEIRRIFKAGVKGLNNLNGIAKKTWQKIFYDGLSLEDCLKRRLKNKKQRLSNKLRRAKTDVREREKKQQRKYKEEYRNRPEVKKRRKRNRNTGQKIDYAEKERPTKKRKIE